MSEQEFTYELETFAQQSLVRTRSLTREYPQLRGLSAYGIDTASAKVDICYSDWWWMLLHAGVVSTGEDVVDTARYAWRITQRKE